MRLRRTSPKAQLHPPGRAPGFALRGLFRLLVLLLLFLLRVFVFFLFVTFMLIFFSAFVTHGVTPFVWQDPFRDLCGTKLVEVGGIEPPSEYNAKSSSTCLVVSLNSRSDSCRPTGHRQSQPFSLSDS